MIVEFGRPAAEGEPVAAAEKLAKGFGATVVPALPEPDGLFDVDTGKLVLDQAQLTRHEGGILRQCEA